MVRFLIFSLSFLFYINSCAEISYRGEVFATKAFLAVIIAIAWLDIAFIFDAGKWAALAVLGAGFSEEKFALLYK